eukprot:8801831-Pyramimonas_sp.AAC.1
MSASSSKAMPAARSLCGASAVWNLEGAGWLVAGNPMTHGASCRLSAGYPNGLANEKLKVEHARPLPDLAPSAGRAVMIESEQVKCAALQYSMSRAVKY